MIRGGPFTLLLVLKLIVVDREYSYTKDYAYLHRLPSSSSIIFYQYVHRPNEIYKTIKSIPNSDHILVKIYLFFQYFGLALTNTLVSPLQNLFLSHLLNSTFDTHAHFPFGNQSQSFINTPPLGVVHFDNFTPAQSKLGAFILPTHFILR